MSPRLPDILAVLARPLLFAVYWLSGLMPRDQRLWLFGSWSGRRYADNAAALFEYVTEHAAQDVRAVWITREADIVRTLRARGLQASLAWSPRGIWLSLRAGVCVFDGLTRDVNHWLTRGARQVLLRHGVGIKRIERCIEHPGHRLYQLFHGSLPQRVFWSIALPWHLVRPDLALATSPQHARQGADSYGIDAEKFAITGFPRNDQIFAQQERSEDDPDLAWLKDCAARGERVALYLPTFRDTAEHFRLGWGQLNDIAERLGIRILIKLHYVDAERGLAAHAAGFARLHVADSYRDANRLYGGADLMVGDYSSAAYDFMLTGKPLVFFIPDEEQFLAFSRSLYYDYEAVTPGPKARSFDELQSALAVTLSGTDSSWSDSYREVLEMFHTYRDGRACQRAYQAIMERFLPDRCGSLLDLTEERADRCES